MRKIGMSFVRGFLFDERGQLLLWAPLVMIAVIAIAGLTIDGGQFYVARSQLQNSTNAAALAAAGGVYNTGTTNSASAVGPIYSSSPGNANFNSKLGKVVTTVTPKCLNMLMPAGLSCATTGAVSNAVVVTQTASVSTHFMALFGVSSLSVSTTATASMQGISQPWNVAIVVDSTGSMNVSDSNCNGGVTEFQCALEGVQALLAATNPVCPSGSSTCPTGASFRVALFTFPNVSTNTVHMDIDCSGNPTALPYTLPAPTATSYAPLTYTTGGASPKTWTATYEVTYPVSGTGVTNAATDADANGFVSDYYAPSSTSTGGLNTSSSIVGAVGYGGPSGKAGCLTYTQGIVNSSIGNTYIASSIYAAQSALHAEQIANPGSKNALIFLSDGQANLFTNQFPSNTTSNASVGCNSGTYSGSEYSLRTCGTSTASQTGAVYLTPATVSSAQAALAYDTLSSASSATGQIRSGTSLGIYPDWYDQCQQGIMAAKAATNAGTNVYAVAYGSESSGCASGWNYTDSSVVATGTYNVPVTLAGLIPCVSMEDIATSIDPSTSTFYSDWQQSGSGIDQSCVDNSHTAVSLSAIFQSIAANFQNPRLLPNNAS